MHTNPAKRHDFALLFDVKNGNPNGDPDAGNLPRMDPETMHGLVTDVSLKRKVRDYAAGVLGQPIFIQSKVSLNALIYEAFKEVGVQPTEVTLNEEEVHDEELMAWLQAKVEAGFSVEEDRLLYAGESVRRRDIEALLKEGLEEDRTDLRQKLQHLAKRLAEAASQGKGQSITPEKRDEARRELCNYYYDIRMFGAVLSTGLNAGQVRGPVQLTFARSLDPILPMDLTITRQARTTTPRLATGPTEMGRKALVPYGLYRAHGFFNPFLARKEFGGTGVREEDLEALWESLERAFDFDHSAARGEMTVRGLWVFTHDSDKGNAPAHKLFELIKVHRKDGIEAPRDIEDYEVEAPADGPLADYPGVTLRPLVRP
jgi:CRISPR-associated protein Csd2